MEEKKKMDTWLPLDVVKGPLPHFLRVFSLLSLACVNKYYWRALRRNPKLQSWKALFLSGRWMCCLMRAIQEEDEEVFRFCEKKGVFLAIKDHGMAASVIGRSGSVWGLENWPLPREDWWNGLVVDEACRNGCLGFLTAFFRKTKWSTYFVDRMAYNAAYGGHLKLLQHIISKAEYVSRALEHAFQGAGEGGYTEIAQWCWENGARDLKSFAIAACKGGSIAMVKKALETGAKPKEVWLVSGAESGQLEMIEYLIELLNQRGVPFNVDTCFRMAASRGHVIAMKRFAMLGVVFSGDQYRSALENAARSGILEAFLYIYGEGDGKADLGLALELASSLGNITVVKWIVRNASVSDECITNAATKAKENGMNDVAAWLKKKKKKGKSYLK